MKRSRLRLERKDHGATIARVLWVAVACACALSSASCSQSSAPTVRGPLELLNVSYDPTRELYRDVNREFARDWALRTHQDVRVKMSHGGAGQQARAVMSGLEADVVTLALEYDINEMARRSLLPRNWRTRLPAGSAPYTSTIVFLVRQRNPKQIRDWDDLVRDGITVITPNPKTSGGARWNYLAAWAYAKLRWGSDDKARDFVRRLFAHVPVLDSGARGATNTFVERGIGDVLLAWENEALLAVRELKQGELSIVVPSLSILAEPPVAWVDRYCTKHKTCKLAERYLRFLYSDRAQEILARHHFRPRSERAMARFRSEFPELKRVTVEEAFGGWDAAQKRHFAEGGEFDALIAHDQQ